MKVAVLIPTRMAATRFPGKPLAKIMGMTMIEHVFQRCALAVGKESVWIATCDREIEEVAHGFGAKVIMTSNTHVRCTDRIAEAARSIQGVDIAINVQGDEPVLDPESLHQVLQPFRDNPQLLGQQPRAKNRSCSRRSGQLQYRQSGFQSEATGDVLFTRSDSDSSKNLGCKTHLV